MMGMTMPTQSSLSDLTTLLQLLHLASDPKTAKATIDTISQARKQYDAAIAESVAKEQAALATLKRVEAADLKAQKSADKAHEKLEALAVKEADIAEAAEALAFDRRTFETYKSEIAKQAHANVLLAKETQDKADAAMAEVDARSLALDEKAKALDAAMATTEAVRADYEAKLARLKAFTE